MLKRLLIISLLLLIASVINSFAQDVKSRIKGPIIVTSEALTTDNKAHTALFEKNVIAKTDNMILYADKMTVYYTENSGDVTKIEATDNVKFHKGTSVITSQNAIYYSDQDKVVLTGEPRAVDGANVVTGTTMTFYLREDRSYIENSKVFLKNNKEN